MQGLLLLFCCFLAGTCARRIAHAASGKKPHEGTGIYGFAPSSFAPGLGRPQMPRTVNFKSGLRIGPQLPTLNSNGRPELRNQLAGRPHMSMDGEVTASSIMNAWSASTSINLRSSVYRKVFRKVDDVFKSWLDYEKSLRDNLFQRNASLIGPDDRWLGEERQSALRAMERLKGKKMNPFNAEYKPWNFSTKMQPGELPDDVVERFEAMEQIRKSEENGHAGPINYLDGEHHIFGLAYTDDAPQHVLAVAEVELTLWRDDNLVLTKAALRQNLKSALSSVVHVDMHKDEEIKRGLEVWCVTGIVAKPTAMQKNAAAELLRAIVDWAKLSGQLVTVEPDNQEMLDFYKQLGFELLDPQIDDRMVYNGDRKAEEAGRENPKAPASAKQVLLVDFVG